MYMYASVFYYSLCHILTVTLSSPPPSIRGRSCEIESSVYRGVKHLGLRVQWLPRAVIESGVAHIVSGDYSSYPVYHPLAIAAVIYVFNYVPFL